MEFSDKARPTQDLEELKREYGAKMSKDYSSKTEWRFGSEKPHPWVGFKTTDPSHHKSSDFAYLVHAIRPYEYEHPNKPIEYFLKKPIVSMSLVFNGNSEAFYRVGFILSVPSGNIVAARPHDIAGFISKENTTEEQFNKAIQEATEIWGVWSPEDLKRFSKIENKYNEVYAISGYRYSTKPKIKISGIFVNRDSRKDIYDLAKSIQSELKVPMVKI